MKIDDRGDRLDGRGGFGRLLVGTRHRAKQAAPPDATAGAVVIVVKATNACFSDMVRVAGYLVPRRMAIVNVDADGYRVTEVMVGKAIR